MQFSKRETATVLAALRLFQKERLDWVLQFPHFGDVSPLTNEEIDTLCEKINCDENKIIIVIEGGSLQGVYSEAPAEYLEYNINEDSNEPLLIYEGYADPIKQFGEDWDKTIKDLQDSER